jgi:hypothetical protein
MHTYYDSWPEGCIESKTSNPQTGQSLYIDLKPGPLLELALYTDKVCATEYVPSSDADATTLDMDTILQENGYLSLEMLAAFNDALLVFSTCQPCRAYNLNNLQNNGGGDGDCDDAAGYTNVNQCMKFRTHTSDMTPVSSHVGLHVAWYQGAIGYGSTNRNSSGSGNHDLRMMDGTIYASPYTSMVSSSSSSSSNSMTSRSSGFLGLSILVFLSSLLWTYMVLRWIQRNQQQWWKRMFHRRQQQQQKQRSSSSSGFGRRRHSKKGTILPPSVPSDAPLLSMASF